MFSRGLNFFSIVKLFFDLIFSFTLIVFLSPLMILISLLIFFEDFQNPFFVQKRIGFNNKLFNMYKFRTMKINSEHKETGYYTFENDKRITKIGKILRKYSLDELPQIFNIITLKMSFVGPRPAIYNELETESITPSNINKFKYRSKVRPGITGYTQVKFRNDLNWNKKIELDYFYVTKKPMQRFFCDVLIVLLTFKEILLTTGEYDKKIIN